MSKPQRQSTFFSNLLIAVVVLFAMVSTLLLMRPEAGPSSQRHRVIVSTDIGGSDPDDFQSLAHLLLYADTLDIEGLISSPWDAGRKQEILDVIDLYEQDLPALQRHSDKYLPADGLRAVTKQGAIDGAGYPGFAEPTEGSEWIVRCARSDDPRPLHLLVWGGIEDLAQALHDAPDIVRKLRVYYIGGPNKKWSPDAYQYIVTHHPKLHIIESNSTYRGWFVGGDQEGEWGNKAFVSKHLAGHGALGDFFATHLSGEIKMGDTPSVARLLHGVPADPSEPSWGGRFVRAWKRPHVVFHRITTKDDRIETFGILELVLALGSGATNTVEAQMLIENQSLRGSVRDGNMHFRFSPKAARTYSYTIQSNSAALNGQTGELTAVPISPKAAEQPDKNLPNWWTDSPDPKLKEGPHEGARTVNRWRRDFLTDFAARTSRLR